MRLIDADELKAKLTAEYNAYRARGTNITMYDISYYLGEILELVDEAHTVDAITDYKKCKDCKYLTGRVSSIGIECMQQDNQKRWNYEEKARTKAGVFSPRVTARYKQKSAKACKKFEPQ